jgi:hypothetical protein
MPGPHLNHLLRNEHENFRPTNFSVCVFCRRDSIKGSTLSIKSIEFCAARIGFL